VPRTNIKWKENSEYRRVRQARGNSLCICRKLRFKVVFNDVYFTFPVPLHPNSGLGLLKFEVSIKGKGKFHPITGYKDPEGSRSITLHFL